MLSGLACWFWLLPQVLADDAPPSGTVGEMAEVAPADMPGALATVNLPGSVAERLRQGDRDCGARLAWVTLSRTAPSQASGQAGTVRLRSGGYFSPPFAVTETPVRVAIPYPAPYGAGRGVLAVLGGDGTVVVGLSPAWHVPASTGAATHPVAWHPAAGCTRP